MWLQNSADSSTYTLAFRDAVNLTRRPARKQVSRGSQKIEGRQGVVGNSRDSRHCRQLHTTTAIQAA